MVAKKATNKSKSGKAPAPSGGEVSPFWKKPLSELSQGEWEALCDGCGKCCLVKLEDEDTFEIHYTNIVCTLFDGNTCQCRDYEKRQAKVPDCIALSMKNVHELSWLPATCAYRVRAEGRDLAWWHPLISGSSETVHEAGISVKGRAGPSEDDVELEDYPDFIVKWPSKKSRPRKPPAPRKNATR